MYILGLTTMGDAAACLIKDGVMVAAAEEERFSRVKHHVGFPHQAVAYVLKEAGITFDDIDHVGLYWKPWVLGRRVLVTLRSLLHSWDAFDARVRRGAEQVGGHYWQMFGMKRRLAKQFNTRRFQFHYLDHHLCHASSCFHVSPFDNAAIFTVDGTGESTTTLFAKGRGEKIEVLKRIKLPHSLGQFYSAITNFLGFDMSQGDEWKVMGLAGWGEPTCSDYLLKNVLVPLGDNDFRLNQRLLDHHLAKRYAFNPELIRNVGPCRRPDEEIQDSHRNLAASAQRALEEVVLRMLRWLHKETGEKNLCLAGGVALNSVLNGRIMRETPFENFYFQPAAGDAGCSLGACYQIWHSLLGKPRDYVMQHAYWGPGFSAQECRKALEQRGLHFDQLDDGELTRRVAHHLAEGNMVAWFQGRMEWGPRGLGNRSFLADPRDANAREKLNQQVKLREWFRPLAPSILEERSADVFGTPRRDPYMITVFPVAADMKARIPAVVHVDGSARPQTVNKDVNRRYWMLLDEFEKISGVPCLLNTSFNIQEPIVCTPEHAINTFLKSRVPYLVLENCLATRAPAATAQENGTADNAKMMSKLLR
jgi:carbamoyltransferase